MLLDSIKNLFGNNCQIKNIYFLSKFLTLVELLGFILCVILYETGVSFGNYHHVFSSYSRGSERLMDTLNISCLFLEFLGNKMKNYQLVIFSCVFRCIWIFFLILAANAMSVVRFLYLAQRTQTILLR